MELSQVLVAASSPDHAVRAPAEQQLKVFEDKSLAHYLLGLCRELNNEALPLVARQLGGIQLKNALSGKSETERQRLALRWTQTVQDDIKIGIKNLLVQTLGSNEKPIRSTAAGAIAAIAAIEVPEDKWPDIIPILHHNITQPASSDALKQSSFEALGYICEECPEPLQDKSSLILTAIAMGMGEHQQNNEIKLAATNALSNCLEFVKSNFAIKSDRDQIMKMIFAAAQSTDERVRVASYQCLVEIASSYYEFLQEYIQLIFQMTGNAIQNEPEEVALQAVEFWSTVCDEEIVLIEEEEDAKSKGVAPENKCHHFMKNALAPFMPLILMSLAKQSEEVDDDTMNIAMAAGTCLGLIAQCTQDDVVDHVLPFVQQNITSENWRLKEAATLAFGYILDGPAREKLEPLVSQAFLLILNHLKDPSALVKDTAAWTIGRICSLVPGCINAETLDPLLQALHGSLKDVPKVSANVCWAIHNLASALDMEDGVQSSPISRYFEGLIRELLATTDRPDANEGNLLCSAWEAINVLIHTAAPDVYPLVGQLVPLFLEKLGQTLQTAGLTGEDREKQNEVQGLLCGALQVIIQKLDESVVKPHADDMMRLFLQVLHSKTATVHEEALHGIGAIASRVGPEFEKYISAFRPYLMLGLQNAQEHHVCIMTVGVVSEIARALERKLCSENGRALCDDIMHALLHNLQDPLIERSVKPHIISCLSDIALAVGGYFERYLPFVMMMLVQASHIKLDQSDYDNHDYLNQLREAVLEAYTGILQGLAGDNQEHMFLQFCQAVLSFLDIIAGDADREEYVLRAAVGVVGDLASRLGDKLGNEIKRPAVAELLRVASTSEDETTRESAQWATSELEKIR